MSRAELQRGFDYAKHQLESKTKTEEELAALADGAIDFTDFDRGIQAALRGEERP